jgi:hypothetical protein
MMSPTLVAIFTFCCAHAGALINAHVNALASIAARRVFMGLHLLGTSSAPAILILNIL